MKGRAFCLWAMVLSLTGCESCRRIVECRMRSSYASCAKGPDCLARTRCAASGAPGRCEPACTPEGPSCGLPSGARHDGCYLDGQPGHEASCFSDDKDPNRCVLATDPRGRPTCFDSRPPCEGCSMQFASCIAREHCFGIVCW